MEEFKIEKPIIDKQKYNDVIKKYLNNINENNIPLSSLIEKTENPTYLYWSDLKYKDWIPTNYSPIDFWILTKFKRNTNYLESPIKSQNDTYFKYFETKKFKEILNRLTLKEIKENLDGYLKSSFIEESISSSEIEGAHTTRSKAKKIILGEEKPSTISDQMILNNFNAMHSLQDKYRNSALSLEVIKELHIILTFNDKSIEDNKKGAFRSNEDEIIIGDNLKNEYTYKAPNTGFLEKEIQNLIDFANREDYDINPIIKAIMIHFWFSYLHPFVDGNGRLARCLFYWFLLKNKLDIFAYYPLSSLIKRSRKQYDNAFLYTEQDDNDLNYFIDYNLRKIIEAKELFEKYFEEKEKEQQNIDKISFDNDLNSRQEQLLKDINLNRFFYITLTYYMNLFDISKPTGIKDLQDLAEKKLLVSKKVGKEVRYYKNR
ncbi:MAG TPA: Fic family protein [Rickettsiales bacterium]|nr:Fic family protein [Rickettsiales bacterium]